MELMFELSRFLAPAGLEWYVAGGHAIDLFVGTTTRKHKDLDVVLFWEQRSTVIEYMLANQWRVFEPDQGDLYEVKSLNADRKVNDNIWCIDEGNPNYLLESLGNNRYGVTDCSVHQDKLDFIEFLFNSKEQGKFIYKRNKMIQRPLQKALLCGQGIPFLAPEVILLYKSTYVHYLNDINLRIAIVNCRHDFSVALPLLSRDQKEWLRQALAAEYPKGHEWLEQL